MPRRGGFSYTGIQMPLAMIETDPSERPNHQPTLCRSAFLVQVAGLSLRSEGRVARPA